MSRSKQNSKHATYEYWSRRPYSQSSPDRRGGKWVKKKTHRLERLQAKIEIRSLVK